MDGFRRGNKEGGKGAAATDDESAAGRASKRSWLKGFLLVTAAMTTAFAAFLLFVPAPAAAIAWAMPRSSDWLLSNYERSGSLPTRAVRKLVGLWLQQGLAWHAREAQRRADPGDDAEKIIRRLIHLKPRFISQTELVHAPPNSPVAVAGLGWCDGINGFAATVLSHDFPRSEIVGVVDRRQRAGHSFGRVWSEGYGGWLYFDMWTDEVVVFQSRAGAGARILKRARPLGRRHLPLESAELIGRIYDNAHSGFTQYRVQPTLGAYLFSRVANLLSSGSTSPQGTVEAIADASAITLPNTARLLAPDVPRAKAAYLEARLRHLLGHDDRAREAYGRVLQAEKGGSSAYAKAAGLFLQRIQGGAAPS